MTFDAVLIGEGDPQLYMSIYAANDTGVVRSDAFRRVADAFIALRDLIDEGSAGRGSVNSNRTKSCSPIGRLAAETSRGTATSTDFLLLGRN